MVVPEILQMTFACLIAYRAIERMIHQKKFNHPSTGIFHFIARDVFNHHAIHYAGAATGLQFRHGARIFSRTCGNFNQARSALTTTAFQLTVVTHGGWCYIATNHSGGLQNRCSGCYFEGNIVDGNGQGIFDRCLCLTHRAKIT